MVFDKVSPIIITNLNELERTEAFAEIIKQPCYSGGLFFIQQPLSDYNHHYGTSFRLPNQREEDGKEAEEKGVDINYIPFYGLHLLAGRNFSSVKEKFDEFIVNERVTKPWMEPEEAVGRSWLSMKVKQRLLA